MRAAPAVRLKMKVLLTTDTIGGVWTYALELARALGEREVGVALATMGAPLSAAQREQISGVADLQLHESTFKLEWMHDPWEDVRRAGDWLLGIEEQFRPDVVHLNGYAHGALPWRAPTLVVAHSCVLSWWKAVKGFAASKQWDRYRREVAAGLRGADMVVAPSRAMLDAVNDHYGPLSDARVILNGRAPEAFLMPTVKEPFILSAGRLWDEAKNVQALASIAGRLPWPVCVAGENEHPDGGQARPADVRLLGKLSLDELAGWLRRASIYALPARYEPFGLTALEAGLAGCALVLGDIPSLREIWKDTAVFVAPDDSAALAHALLDLIHDAKRREEFARRARSRALTYSPSRMGQGYLRAYGALSNERKLHACAL